MARITFDSLTHPDNVVELAGHDYAFPGDPPIPLIMRLQQATSDLLDAGEEGAKDDHLTAIYDALFALFAVCDPNLEHLPVGPRALLPLALAVISPERYIKQDPAEDPTSGDQPPAGTPTKTSSPSKPKKTAAKRTKSSS